MQKPSRTRPRWLALTLAALVLAGISGYGYDPASRKTVGPPEPEEHFALALSPNDYLRLAWTDAITLPPEVRRCVRYLAIQDGDPDSTRTTNYTLNLDSRSRKIRYGTPLADYRLLRVDLSHFFPDHRDLEDALKTWEELAFDPLFSLLITRDTIDFIKLPGVVVERRAPGTVRTEDRVVDHPGGDYRYPDDSGRVSRDVPAGRYTVHLRFNVPGKKIDADLLRHNGQHLVPSLIVALQDLLGTQAPVVDHRYFKFRALSQIQDFEQGKDSQLYQLLWGGLYYRFNGVKKSDDKGVTDEAKFFRDFLRVHVGQPKNAQDLFLRIDADQRAMIAHSDITGSPRIIVEFPVEVERIGGNRAYISIDVRDQDVDQGDRGFKNARKPRVKGQEAIVPKDNGLRLCLALNGNGDLVDEVPFQIASDRSVPTPGHTRLQPGKSCIFCHQTDGSDFNKPFRSVAKVLFGRRGKVDVFGELSARRREFDPDTFDLLDAQYLGDFRKNQSRDRDDTAEVTLAAASLGPDAIGWPKSEKAGADVCQLAAKHLEQEYNGYRYKLVDARQALLECGFVVPRDRAVFILNLLLQPDGRSELFGGVLGGNADVIPEDPTLALLLAGESVTRFDFALSYSFLKERIDRRVSEFHSVGLTWYGEPPKFQIRPDWDATKEKKNDPAQDRPGRADRPVSRLRSACPVLAAVLPTGLLTELPAELLLPGPNVPLLHPKLRGPVLLLPAVLREPAL